MSRIIKRAKAKFSRAKVAVAGAVAVVGATSSQAGVDVSGVLFDVGSIETIAAAMLGALALIWVARKIINLINDDTDNEDITYSSKDYPTLFWISRPIEDNFIKLSLMALLPKISSWAWVVLKF